MFELNNAQLFMHSVNKRGLNQSLTLCGSAVLFKKYSDEELQIAVNNLLRENKTLRTYFIEKNQKTYQDFETYKKKNFKIKFFNSIEEMDEFGKIYATIPQNYKIVCDDEKDKIKKKKSHNIFLLFNYLKLQNRIKKNKKKLGLMDNELSCFDIILIQLPNASGAFIKMNHIISDGWSMYLIANQLLKSLNNEEFKSYEYNYFIENNKNYELSERGIIDKEYFKNEWLKYPNQTVIFPGRIYSFKGKRKEFAFDIEVSNKIKNYCKENQISESVFFISAIGIALYNKIKNDKFYVGMINANRLGLIEKNMVGLAALQLPLLLEVSSKMSFKDFLVLNKEKTISLLRRVRGYVKPKEVNGLYTDFYISFRNATINTDSNLRIKEYFSMAFGNVVTLAIEENFNTKTFNMYFDHNIKIKDVEAIKILNEISNIINKVLNNNELSIKDLTVED